MALWLYATTPVQSRVIETGELRRFGTDGEQGRRETGVRNVGREGGREGGRTVVRWRDHHLGKGADERASEEGSKIRRPTMLMMMSLTAADAAV